MTHFSEDTKSAVQQLAKGATLGMVDAALQKEGLGSGPRAEVLEVAKRIVNRRARIKNILIGAIGLLIVVAGGCWYYICVVNRDHRVTMPSIVMVTGLLFGGYGVFNATQDEIQ